MIRSSDVPDHGSLRHDVLAVLRQASSSFRELGAVGPDIIRGLTSELRDLPPTEAFLVMNEAMMRILRRAAARGEVRLGHGAWPAPRSPLADKLQPHAAAGVRQLAC